MHFIAIKNENFQQKKIDIFSNFCSKHRLRIHVKNRRGGAHGSNEYLQCMFWNKNKTKINISLQTRVLLYEKGEGGGGTYYTDMLS